jgi:hypothetical protein
MSIVLNKLGELILDFYYHDVSPRAYAKFLSNDSFEVNPISLEIKIKDSLG